MSDTKYKTTFFFYYNVAQLARAEYVAIRKLFMRHEVHIKKVTNEKTFWVVTLIVNDLTANQVHAWDIVLKHKYPLYDGWEVDTRDPQQTMRDFGYNFDVGTPEELKKEIFDKHTAKSDVIANSK